VKETWQPAAWIVQVFLLQRSQRNTFLTEEQIDLEDDPQAALAAHEVRGLSLQVSQCRRGRLSQDWHPYALSTPFSWACIEYKLTGESRYTSGTMPTDYTFTGQFSHVDEFGLLYYVARFYDPALGRFSQADSIVPGSQPLAFDRYAYTLNTP
jgi:RHS repeat-associated protein